MNLDLMKISVVGVTPLILHNGRTANPLDPYTKKLKALTSKRQKTDEDLEEMLLLQWEAGLYWSDKLGVYMPSENLSAAFYKAAKKYKLGVKTSGVSFVDPIGYSINTKNSKDMQKLKADQANKFVKTVVIQRNKAISCRPIFEEWAISFELEFDPQIIDANEIKTILSCMSQRVGFGVWNPGSPKPGTYGKFLIKSIEWTNSKTKEVKKIEGGI